MTILLKEFLKMGIKAINLDFYGTLVDWLHIWINRLNEKILSETPKPRFETNKLDEIFEFLK